MNELPVVFLGNIEEKKCQMFILLAALRCYFHYTIRNNIKTYSVHKAERW